MHDQQRSRLEPRPDAMRGWVRQPSRSVRLGAVFSLSLVLSLLVANYLGSFFGTRELAVESIGPRSASHRLVYLHGIDSRWPSWTEIENREVLRALAGALDVRITLVRSPVGSWPRASNAALQQSASWIMQAAHLSFGETQDYGLLGFSDGGYLIGDLFASGRLPGNRGGVLVGGGAWTDRGVSDLSRLGRLVIMAGRYDPGALEGLHQYAALLRAKGAQVSIVEYPGGHQLPLDATRDALADLWVLKGTS